MGLMNEDLLELLDAETGAVSVITPREATRDKSVTLDRYEKEVLKHAYPEMDFPRRGSGDGDYIREERQFYVHPYNDLEHAVLENAYIVYPKANKDELRLYFSESSRFTIRMSAFRNKLADGISPHWYIFKKNGDDIPHIGMADSNYLRIRNNLTQVRENSNDAAYQADLQSDLAGQKVNVRVFRHQRKIREATTALAAAGFVCEANQSHETFVTAASGNAYVEGHHLIPLSYQDRFEYSIDVKENIVALCPNCHRLLHHGTYEDKMGILLRLWDNRRNNLYSKNIGIDSDTLLSYYQ